MAKDICDNCEHIEECRNDDSFVCILDDRNPINSEAYMLEDE